MKNVSLITLIFLLLLSIQSASAQVENVHIYHPVYKFLLIAETKGILPHYSHSDLPLRRNEITAALNKIRNSVDKLSRSEQKMLSLYETEFEITSRENAVLIYSDSDSSQVISADIFSDKEKFIYHYSDSVSYVSLIPLGEFDFMYQSSDEATKDALIMNFGFRLIGSWDNHLGYSLQATNGSLLSGDRDLAVQDAAYSRNVKFVYLEDDIDFTESHVTYQYDWFYASLSRESRQIGAGLFQRVFQSDYAPPVDALVLGVDFESFDYKFMHAGVIGEPDSALAIETGFALAIDEKYFAMHRFAFKPTWGEISFWESVVYSGRGPDISYLLPLSFYKSLEHAKRDRDNSVMGFDVTLRPVAGLQFKGAFILDDMVFDKIGTGYWSNKTAVNAALMMSYIPSMLVGVEYARVEPYTFTHFNSQNSYTNDGRLIGSYLLPNSEQYAMLARWYFGGRYPLDISLKYSRHGDNIYDESGNLTKNVGGDPEQTRRYVDSPNVTFLEGDLQETFEFGIASGIDIFRGFNLQAAYSLQNINSDVYHNFRLRLRFSEF